MQIKNENINNWFYAIAYMLLLFVFSYTSILNALLHQQLSMEEEYLASQSLWFSSMVNFGLLFMVMLDYFGTNRPIGSRRFTIGVVIGCFLIIALRELVFLHKTEECLNYIYPIDQIWFVYLIHFLFFCCMVFLKTETMTINKEKISVVRV